MTLYDRLKPEYRKIMDTYAGDHKLVYHDAKSALTANKFWLDMTYGQFLSIQCILGPDVLHPRQLLKDA